MPLRYGPVELINPKRPRLRGEEAKEGVEAIPVFCGFCGTDFELMKMGSRLELSAKFPPGTNRLINGHEGVVYVPSEKRFAIVLIRGGDSVDPTRFTEDESYFEYGCDGADGLFADMDYFNPDMLLHIPSEYERLDALPLSLAKKLVFSDPYACAVFQHERLCDIGSAQLFRVVSARDGCSFEEARVRAVEETFSRTVIFGLGTTGLFIGDQIRRNHPDANILFVARSGEDSKKARFAAEHIKADYLCSNGLDEKGAASLIIDRFGGRPASVFIGTSGTETEHRVAFDHGALGCNGIYDSFSLGPRVSFDSMPFGFKNQVVFASINFTRRHMEQAIEILAKSDFDELVELIDKDEFIRDPMEAYVNRIYSKSAPLKTAVIWNEKYIDGER